MMLTLGIIIGLLIAVLIVSTLIFMKHPMDHKINLAKTALENLGPRPKGYIFEPPTEAEESRANIIEKNKKKGLDTRISELE